MYLLLAKLILVGALLACLAWGVHRYNEGLRDEGRADVQAKWDAAVAAGKAREAAAAKEADDFANRLDADRTKRYAALAKHSAQLEAQLASEHLSAALTASLRNSISASNGEGSRPPASTDTAATGLALDGWVREVTQLYSTCRDRVAEWIKWDDSRVGG